MKRLVWLILAVFGTALAQVSPVELPVTKHDVCGCCEHPGACGMPDCPPPAAPAPQPASILVSPATAVRLAAKPAARVRIARQYFSARYPASAAVAPVPPAAPVRTVPASVPLYREHCSLLI